MDQLADTLLQLLEIGGSDVIASRERRQMRAHHTQALLVDGSVTLTDDLGAVLGAQLVLGLQLIESVRKL